MSSAPNHTPFSLYEAVSESATYRAINEQLVNGLPTVRGRVVVDLGCGTGSISELILGQEPSELWAIDPDVGMLTAAERRLGGAARYVLGSTEAARDEVGRGRADIVVLANTIHLIDDIPSALTHMRELTAPNGTMAFNTGFFVGAEHPADKPMYMRLMLDAKRIARRRGLAPAAGRSLRTQAKRPNLTEDYFLGEVERAGFQVTACSTAAFELGSDLVRSICISEVFASGALPHLEPADASSVLEEAVDGLFASAPDRVVTRRWLSVTATRPATLEARAGQ